MRRAADGALPPRHTTFLSPFDSLFWARDRDMQFWEFRQVLECYKPEAQRIWGYYCLPILHRDRLVGRFDPKLERDTGTLRLKTLYLEPGVAPDEPLVAEVAAAMRDFMAFHDATDLVIERSDPLAFGAKLRAAL
ncbi:MAG: winged helix DNA-binding domain-containing protein [Anaerolineae bacterium]|nr:winged helix DNA-binding domain-containing protein [Anaerolineae bacterium]